MSCRLKWRFARRPVLCKAIAVFGGALFLQLPANMTKAQTKPSSAILVQCNGANDVPAQTQEMLCAGLQIALSKKYPAMQFSRSTGDTSIATPTVTLQTFVANDYGMELGLNWMTADRGTGEGPRLGFSIVDKAMTPDMQLKFLNRVVQDTALPF